MFRGIVNIKFNCSELFLFPSKFDWHEFDSSFQEFFSFNSNIYFNQRNKIDAIFSTFYQSKFPNLLNKMLCLLRKFMEKPEGASRTSHAHDNMRKYFSLFLFLFSRTQNPVVVLSWTIIYLLAVPSESNERFNVFIMLIVIYK